MFMNKLYKTILIGETGVGKSSVLNRFADDIFVNNYRTTIGIDFKTKTLNVENQTVKLQLWDTAGQERFGTLGNSFYRGVKIIILVYDLSNKSSWTKIDEWYSSVMKQTNNSSCEYLLLGNKSDLNNIQVDEDEVKKWCLEKGNMVNFKCSAKTGENVTEAFELLVSHVVNPELKKKYNFRDPNINEADY
ncbi:small rab-related gtpase [Anaeramoeba flamelloides]|uniref:Small rab-related gtpase n=1 Tax=Anaeramoeba flamelloides TaxID=1746091 RepID=A0AAV7Z4Q8_9EUKA|nr:small rab-related gtpase [Anaeramoeba flamelloides]